MTNSLLFSYKTISYIIAVVTLAVIKLTSKDTDEYLDMPDLLTDTDTDSDSD